MPMLRKVSGDKLLKVLCNKFGFSLIRKKGSHFILTKVTSVGKIGTVVPMHKEIKIGTLKGILKQAKISDEEIVEFL
ncbi:type II toxin-antitoxin system HicA family toxin [Candidatus Pacearchaeota archaeon]|nr:type II toxin-antitoxin system HicA family toxin [Candidatus Pacearchaeota archaeon]